MVNGKTRVLFFLDGRGTNPLGDDYGLDSLAANN